MSTKYPTLTEMDIKNPEQIYRFSLQESGDSDTLRIIFKRERGSLLPGSKKFKFRRLEKIIQDSNNKTKIISEASPSLTKAINELHSIVDRKHNRLEKKAVIADEILRLEEEVNSRINYLKSLVDDLDD